MSERKQTAEQVAENQKRAQKARIDKLRVIAGDPFERAEWMYGIEQQIAELAARAPAPAPKAKR